MEEKESETLRKILKVSADEFLEYGFRGASLRAIVKKAGVTTGAFYGYFKSKEELFDALVKKNSDYLIELYKSVLFDFEKLSFDEQKKKIDNYSKFGLEQMFSYVWDHKESFRLILKSSAGTRYEHYIQDLAQLDTESNRQFNKILESQGIYIKHLDPLVERLLMTGMFTSLFNIIFEDITKEKALWTLNQMHEFFKAGGNCLMEAHN